MRSNSEAKVLICALFKAKFINYIHIIHYLCVH